LLDNVDDWHGLSISLVGPRNATKQRIPVNGYG
jgi:hypothetical protein